MELKDIFGTGEIGKEIINQSGHIVKETIHNLSSPLTKVFGERLADILDLIFTPIEKLKIYKDHKIELFKKKLEEEINKIPEEKRITPPLQIIGPAVEGAKFYIEREELRNMFAILIASSMNIEKCQLIHPSYIEIIKQLSPLDAVNMSFFLDSHFYHMVDYALDEDVNFPILSNVSLGISASNDIYDISISLTNLIRLGLLEKDVTVNLQTPNEYFDDKIISQLKIVFDDNKNIDEFRNSIKVNSSLIRITSYGIFFITACHNN